MLEVWWYFGGGLVGGRRGEGGTAGLLNYALLELCKGVCHEEVRQRGQSSCTKARQLINLKQRD